MSDYSSLGDAVSEFRNAMLDVIGTAPDEIIDDGVIHRFKIDGKLAGAYTLHTDGRPAGFFQDFKRGIKEIWRASAEHRQHSDQERQAYKLRLLEEQKQRQKEELLKRQQAAAKARSIWNHSGKLPDNHPYLIRKQIMPNNARLNGESVVIPVFNRYRQMVSIQFINKDGDKRFLRDGEIKGCFSVIGRTSQQPLAIVEGWATGCSVYEHRGHQTFVAFSAGNLELVARVLLDIFPMREIIVFGDRDESQVGQKAALAAADAVDGSCLLPPEIGDWNDFYTGAQS